MTNIVLGSEGAQAPGGGEGTNSRFLEGRQLARTKTVAGATVMP